MMIVEMQKILQVDVLAGANSLADRQREVRDIFSMQECELQSIYSKEKSLIHLDSRYC